MKRTKGFVGFHQFFPDGNILGTVLFAFSTADTLGGEGRLFCKSNSLAKLKTSGTFGLRVHGIVTAEDSRYVDAFGTGHAVAAPGAADFFFFTNLCLDSFKNCQIFLCQLPCLCKGGDPAVFLDHFQGIHAGEDNRHLRLVVEPAEGPFCGRPAASAVLHDLFCAGRQHVHKLSAPQRLHDHDGNPFCGGSTEAVYSGLGNLIKIVVLNLAEIPVVILQDHLEMFRISMKGKTDIPDSSGLFFLFDPVQDSDSLQLFPHGQVGQVVHQIIIHIVGPEAGKLLMKIFVQALSVFDHELWKLGGDIDLFADVIPLKDFSDGSFAPGIDIGRVVIINSGMVGSHDFLLRLFQVDVVSFSAETHTAEAQYRERIIVSIFPIEHLFFL